MSAHEEFDPAVVQKTLSSPPFIPVEGVINFRDLGLSAASGSAIRPGLLFRSGELTRISPRGAATLARELGVRTVFDLRSETEVAKFASATPSVEGLNEVVFVSAPVSEGPDYDPATLAMRVASFATDEKTAFATMYAGILAHGGPAYETIFKHIRDNPGSACLVHCTGGKDRTGVFAAIVQLLMGVPDEAIIEDYYLTTIGLQPALPALIERFQKLPPYSDNWDAFRAMGSAKKDTMRATLAMIREKYGSAEGYLKQNTSLTDDDIARIRENLKPSSDDAKL